MKDILDCVFKQKLSHDETASKFNIKRKLVTSLVISCKRDSKFLEKQ